MLIHLRSSISSNGTLGGGLTTAVTPPLSRVGQTQQLGPRGRLQEEGLTRMDDPAYPRAMIVVDCILRALATNPTPVMELLYLPADKRIVASEFDGIYQRWLDEES